MNKILPSIYILVIFSLFLYSFTQIDLSIVISQNTAILSIQKAFQYIGYFNRPLSATLYIIIILSLFSLYITFLKQALRKKLTRKVVWGIIIAVAAILTFSYNAFSYDLFNYIFDAKIISFYNQNPYLHKALDYTGDPMLSFMRWTHRVYPYGPIWLFLTVPLSYLGSQSFVITFGLFKVLMSLSFIGAVFMIGKIFKKYSPQDEVFGLIFFGLNPLIIIESLISSHIDIVMMFFALTSVYLLIENRFVSSWVALVVSIGIKFATTFLVPIFLFKTFFDKKNTHSWDQMFYLSTILMAVTIIAASTTSGNFQPWYLIPFLTLATFVSKRPIIFIAAVLGSLVSLLNYVPYLLLGVWDARLAEYINLINTSGLVIILASTLIYTILHPRRAY